jgi:ATP/maltotriose-dependent transcriptional regulator MalT/DNA-binding SARP family transcriptional activator
VVVDTKDGQVAGETGDPREPGRALIRRKLLAPALGKAVVGRPRVTDLLRAALDAASVVTVCAAAGSGKSTAVAGALVGIDRPVAWVSLDGAESAAGRLLLYLEAAVSPHAPEAGGAATDALAAGLPVSEAAGLLAESLYGSDVVLVCDNVERVVSSSAALATLSALARYVPPGVSLVLVSRVVLPIDAGSTGDLDRIREVTDRDLAFTVAEARAALERAGRSDVDAESAVRRSEGWVTGVLFAGGTTDQAPDRLHRYITGHVLAALPEEEQQFLVRTSLLAEVSVEDASALGIEDAGRLIGTLRGRHLPVVWQGLYTFSLAPQFRDHLLGQLALDDPRETAALRRNHASLLVRKGELEEAVDTLIELGDHDRAWGLAAELLPRLVERMDLALAGRWLDAFPDASNGASPQLASDILRVAFGLEQPGRGCLLLERNDWTWVERLARAGEDRSDEALCLLAWCLWHKNNVAEAERVVDLMQSSRAKDIADAVLGLSRDEAPRSFPELATTPAGPLEGLLMRVAYTRGRLHALGAPGVHGPWRSVLGAPWVIAGLRATGRIEQAIDMYELHRDKSRHLWLHGVDAAELMADLGREDDAWEAVRTGWEHQGATGSRVYAALLHLVEAELHLRLGCDTDAALRAVDAADDKGARIHSFTREFGLLWRGLAHLLRGDDATARDLLQTAVSSMQTTDHRLQIVPAATYLSEAHWRAGEEDAADAAAALALRSAEEMGSLHLLLTALEDVPAVAVRGADTEAIRTSRWHELTTLLSRRGRLEVASRHPRLVLEDFGVPVLLLDGIDVTPRLRKSVELLACILGSPGRTISRQDVLDALFHSRSEPAARSYLRQAPYRLRDAVPDDLAPVMDTETLTVPGPDLIVATSEDVLAMIGQADRQDDENRLLTLTEALARTDGGPYLHGFGGDWVDRRRDQIDGRLLRARLDLAKVAYRLGRYWESGSAVDLVLAHDPYREDAWLLRLSLAHASGTDDGVLATYQRYVATMREAGVPPSAEVQRQLSRMRS